jgi:hypothetical protein
MMADVLGAFVRRHRLEHLVAFMSESLQPVNSFSIGPDGTYNELPLRRGGARSRRTTASGRSPDLASVRRLVAPDEPFADVSMFPPTGSSWLRT